MDIIVCVKRVPATDIQVKVGADGKSIDPAGVTYVLNPYDEFAVEEALKIKEKVGSGSVTVLSIGPAEAQKEVRTCLAMGADKGFLLQVDGGTELDSYAVSTMLAARIKTLPHNLILLGKQAVDQDCSQIGQRLATLLGCPCISEAVKTEIGDGKITVEKDAEGGREVIEANLPAVVTAQKGLNEPRYASLKGIMAAKKKPLEITPAEVVGAKLQTKEITLPPPRPAGKIVGKGVEAVPELVRLLQEEAKIL